ncbi:MAG TPA: ABC transporter [Cyanobacteria bacterium UBA8156]|nr:ABC transporter [Cyanobacteria bacterium UBA8156]
MPPLQRLLQYGRRYRELTNQAIACSVLNKIFDLAPPGLIGLAVDTVVRREEAWLGGGGAIPPARQLLFLSLFSAVVWALESGFEYAYARLWRNLAQNVQHDLRLAAYGHLQELEMAFFEERSTGGLMSLLSDDINQLERFLDGGANEVLQVLTTVILIGGAFLVMAPGPAFWAMVPMPFILWGSIRFQGWLAPRYAAVREKVSLLNGQLANNLGGIATIKSFATEDYENRRIQGYSDHYRHSNQHAIALSAAYVPLIRILVFAGFISILFLGGLGALRGEIAVGTYSVMVFLTQRLLWPLTRLGETLDQYQRAMASTRRVFGLLDTPVQIHPGDRRLEEEPIRGEVRFLNVNFAYQSGYPVLEKLDLRVPAGSTVGIVGPTGSGKSTLVKLLLRLYETETGTILLDGQDLRTLDLRSLRRAIALVSQDVFLFHGTVAANIAYGTFEATPTDIERAAKTAEAHNFIMGLPRGYDTIIGERGQKLSGGQRQRLAIARAVLKDAPVLILDEATSAVDNETELAIQRSLEKITAERTTLAIAHRLSTVRHADCIYVMEGGKITEKGTHEELLHLGGTYANLWYVQTGDHIATV